MNSRKVAIVISKDRFEPVLEKVVAQLAAELGRDLEGVVLDGVPGGGADRGIVGLELHVVNGAAWRQRRALRIDDVDVTLVIEPVSRIRDELADSSKATLAAFALGRILHDPRGVTGDVTDEARRLWNEAPPPVTRDELPRLRHRATELLRDAEAIRDVDDHQATFLLFHALEEIVSTLYRLHRWRRAPARHLLADLRHRAPDLEPRVRRIIGGGGSVSSRVFWLGELIREVLEPVGGTLDESPREEVPTGH